MNNLLYDTNYVTLDLDISYEFGNVEMELNFHFSEYYDNKFKLLYGDKFDLLSRTVSITDYYSLNDIQQMLPTIYTTNSGRYIVSFCDIEDILEMFLVETLQPYITFFKDISKDQDSVNRVIDYHISEHNNIINSLKHKRYGL